jgi:hypothetical protein
MIGPSDERHIFVVQAPLIRKLISNLPTDRGPCSLDFLEEIYRGNPDAVGD